MKLVPKIYLAFASILLIFSFVTFTYVRQSGKVEENIKLALTSSEALRAAEGMNKAVIDAETGVRGFQISDNEAFLAPYYRGKHTYELKRKELLKLVTDEDQLRIINSIDDDFNKWQRIFAEQSIRVQRRALESPEHMPEFLDFKENVVRKGVGKRITDQIRKQFMEFEHQELLQREARMNNLNQSVASTRNLSVILTGISILIGIIVVILLAKTIRGRLSEMSKMANEVAMGHFDVALKDSRQDEISQVSDSLNIMAMRLNDNFATLQKKNHELDQFAYVVSHDLKAPLRAINSLAEWIEEDLLDIDPEVKHNLELMRGRVLRMENLINGILEYSRIGRKKLPQDHFATTQLVHEIIDSLSPEEHVKIIVQPDLPEVVAERILMYQVFANLISNAIKYNDKPEPVIEIGFTPQATGNEFWVKDNGPGIPKEYHQKVFGIFQTMESRDKRESTGIGLAIVKKILEEKGGNIRLESGEGEGSTFIFCWPKGTETETSQRYSTHTQLVS